MASADEEGLAEFNRTLAAIEEAMSSEGPVAVSEAQESFRDRYAKHLRGSGRPAAHCFARRERKNYERSMLDEGDEANAGVRTWNSDV